MKMERFGFENNEQFNYIKKLCDLRYGITVPKTLKNGRKVTYCSSSNIKSICSSSKRIDIDSLNQSETDSSEEFDEITEAEFSKPKVKKKREAFRSSKDHNRSFETLQKYLNFLLIQSSNPLLEKQFNQFKRDSRIKSSDKESTSDVLSNQSVYKRMQNDIKHRESCIKRIPSDPKPYKSPIIRTNTNMLRKSKVALKHHENPNFDKRRTTVINMSEQPHQNFDIFALFRNRDLIK